MARAKITYVHNPQTGKREFHIDYESPSDATVHEHEARHRKLVKEIIGDLTDPEVDVDRGQSAPPSQPKEPDPQPQRLPPKTNNT
jgi:hypothetical protein